VLERVAHRPGDAGAACDLGGHRLEPGPQSAMSGVVCARRRLRRCSGAWPRIARAIPKSAAIRHRAASASGASPPRAISAKWRRTWLQHLAGCGACAAPHGGGRHRTAGAGGLGQGVAGRPRVRPEAGPGTGSAVHLENAAEPRERPDGMPGAAARGVEMDRGGGSGTGRARISRSAPVAGPAAPTARQGRSSRAIARREPVLVRLRPGSGPGARVAAMNSLGEPLRCSIGGARRDAPAGGGARRPHGRPSPRASSGRARSVDRGPDPRSTGRRSGSAGRAAGGRRTS